MPTVEQWLWILAAAVAIALGISIFIYRMATGLLPTKPPCLGPAWTNQCVLGPGAPLQRGTVRGEVRIDLDPEGRVPISGPLLTLQVQGSTLCTTLLLSPHNMRDLARCLLESADQYEELDANWGDDVDPQSAGETD